MATAKPRHSTANPLRMKSVRGVEGGKSRIAATHRMNPVGMTSNPAYFIAVFGAPVVSAPLKMN